MQSVGLFVTCLVDCLRPQIGVAALDLLRQSGASVVYPPTQSCCGQVAFNSGYNHTARQLVEKCADEFAECDYVVMPSGSCCGALHEQTTELFTEPSAKITAFRQKCLELSQYLDKVNFTPTPTPTADKTITYHDSCAGLRELGIKTTPRRLLAAAGFTIREMHSCEECCGFGGRFAEQFGALSVAMADKKCANINAVSADAVVAGDVGCLLHIEGRLRRLNNPLPIVHWAELVANPAMLAAGA